MPSRRSIARVGVVGAGIAGLAAARRLAHAGVEVTVLDKARRPGGRLSTRRSEGLAFDHGAQYFTCRDPDFAPLVEDWEKRGVVRRWNGPVRTLRRGEIGEEEHSVTRYVGVPGMSALGRDLESDLDVRCGTRFARIGGPPSARRLVDETGGELGDFDAVLVATPAPQAVPLLSAVPELASRVADVEMAPCIALLAGFDEPVAPELGAAFVSDSPLRWIARNDSKPGRPDACCWVLHAGPEWSDAHLEQPPDTWVAPLLSAFAEALGRELPAPRYASAHRWRYALTRTPLARWFLWDEAARIGACGDWTVGGRVEGAFVSGDRLARAVLGEPVDEEIS